MLYSFFLLSYSSSSWILSFSPGVAPLDLMLDICVSLSSLLLTILTRDKVYSRLAQCWALLKESIVTWDLVPQVCYSDRVKLAPDVQSDRSDANAQRGSCCPGSSDRFTCHGEPLSRIHLVLASEDLVDHGHVGLVAPLQLFQLLFIFLGFCLSLISYLFFYVSKAAGQWACKEIHRNREEKRMRPQEKLEISMNYLHGAWLGGVDDWVEWKRFLWENEKPLQYFLSLIQWASS